MGALFAGYLAYKRDLLGHTEAAPNQIPHALQNRIYVLEYALHHAHFGGNGSGKRREKRSLSAESPGVAGRNYQLQLNLYRAVPVCGGKRIRTVPDRFHRADDRCLGHRNFVLQGKAEASANDWFGHRHCFHRTAKNLRIKERTILLIPRAFYGMRGG